MFETVLPVRVYYEDTDAGGIVYHASYLRFMERGRTESLRSLGVNLTDLLNKYNIQFVLKKCKLITKKLES